MIFTTKFQCPTYCCKKCHNQQVTSGRRYIVKLCFTIVTHGKNNILCLFQFICYPPLKTKVFFTILYLVFYVFTTGKQFVKVLRHSEDVKYPQEQWHFTYMYYNIMYKYFCILCHSMNIKTFNSYPLCFLFFPVKWNSVDQEIKLACLL